MRKFTGNGFSNKKYLKKYKPRNCIKRRKYSFREFNGSISPKLKKKITEERRNWTPRRHPSNWKKFLEKHQYPINIDGSQVSGITIDGDEVQEVTMDGDVVWRSETIIDDFEDGDLSEYFYGFDESNGKAFKITTTSYEGSNALRGSAGANTQAAFFSTSGLPEYPEAGDTIVYRQREEIGDNNHNSFFFGVQDNPDSNGGLLEGDYYVVTFDQENEQLALHRRSSSNGHSTLAKTDQTFSTGVWYKVEIDWGSGGTITVTLYDENGSLVNQITGNDSTFTSGGIGFYLDGQDSAEGGFTIDYVKIGD